METLESDAFVFFGATGDLAYEQIFPALQAMTRRGHFDMPIIGVARSAKDLDGLRARARESIEKHGSLDPPRICSAFGKTPVCQRRLRLTVDIQPVAKGAWRCISTSLLPSIPPDLFATVAEGLAHAECDKGARLVVEKPFGRDLSSAQAPPAEIVRGQFRAIVARKAWLGIHR